MSMSSSFGLRHSFVIQRQSGSDHSCFVIFTPLTSDNGFVGQALPLAIRWIGRRRRLPYSSINRQPITRRFAPSAFHFSSLLLVRRRTNPTLPSITVETVVRSASCNRDTNRRRI